MLGCCFFGSSGGVEAGDDGGDNHNCEGDCSEPAAPGCGGDVGGFYDDGSDGEGLDEHFDFSGGDGSEVDAFCFVDMAQRGDVSFP